MILAGITAGGSGGELNRRSHVEGICKDKGVKSGNVNYVKGDKYKTEVRKDLWGKIAGLAEKNYVTHETAEMLNQHRFLGNAAAHEMDRPSNRELNSAFDIIDHVLKEIYELKRTHEELKRSRERRQLKK